MGGCAWVGVWVYAGGVASTMGGRAALAVYPQLAAGVGWGLWGVVFGVWQGEGGAMAVSIASCWLRDVAWGVGYWMWVSVGI